jgi:hypothetical protein
LSSSAAAPRSQDHHSAGGYAGAKATQRFITGYAQEEANRAGLEVTFTTVLPRLTPLTDLGRLAVNAYAARNGQSVDEYLESFGPLLSPEIAGDAIVELIGSQPTDLAPAYLLTGTGLQKLPRAA